ncbi:putative fatty-acid--CoA ligase [Gordonia effusa NBRC 100432]|uniref:Putative fatty-acid--CoA ligase n=1 Tax=Gordonia effusa NBRC 100432 TaxID=1077974 RepID=H0R1N3_9ACTN|nr:AMP-binding protein [Gordonia effusa]GAB18984.1 putative fatty-acid--CoA ligase [Gordonia effusa NBRC 100432]
MNFSILPSVGSAVDRVVATAQNGLEVLRLGGLDTGTQPAPFQIVETENMFRLRRYFPDDPGTGPHVVLVPPMMVSANVYDVTEHNGAVSILHEAGIIPWVIDFGSPDREVGGMERTLADHIVAVSRVIDIVHETVGRDVHLGGYSQGGMFAYQTAAYRRSKGIASLITFGSPVDVLGALPLGLPANLVAPGAEFMADKILPHVTMPSWMARAGFQLADPVKTARSRIDFLRRLHDRDALLPREDQRRFIEADGWVAWSGPAIAELLRQFVVHNRMVSGGFVINGDLVSLAEITCPVLAFVGEADDIGQPKAVRGILRAAPSADVYESRVPVGHFGLVVGSTAGAQTWPTTSEWINWQEGDGEKPERMGYMREVEAGKSGGGVSLSSRLTHGLGAVADAGAAAGREVFEAASSIQRTSLAVAQESVRTVPRLFRLGQIQSGTRISLGKLMSENNKRAKHSELFLFENRVLTHAQVNTRIDNVVAGLISCGIRPGQHIGVLMDTRPSALVVVAALSRIGAVSVMLSGEWNLEEMLRMADTRIIVTDPSHLDVAVEHSKNVLVLGGGSGDSRAIAQADGNTIIDMEQIDPAAVEIPSWYRPDPGLAGDLAFVLFTRAGGKLSRWPITNHRFAMSAFGAASAAGLTSGDTVYCLPPLHHASGLLTTLGATVAGRSRIALSDGVDATTFTTEVHRYGVTVVSYTWSMMREIIRSPKFSINQHNPIRLFMGSGMPPGLWEEVLDSFPRAKVLEFFATADGSAILANVAGDKIGSMGQALPETNPVQIAGVDPVRESLEVGDNGYVRRANVDEVGVLLSRARQRFESSSTVLRDVFSSHDRWELSGHLFRQDPDGDYWYMGTAAAVVRSADGYVFLPPIEDALSRVKAIDQVVAYVVGEPGEQTAIAAITVRTSDEGQPNKADSITVTQLRTALGGLPAKQRPHIICLVDEIPVSESYRPLWVEMAKRGVPAPGPRVWYRDEGGRYRRYTKSAAAQLQWGASK